MEQSALAQFDNKLLDGLVFCRLVYDHFEQVRLSEGGVRTLRSGPRPVKRLLEELLPIARYVQAHYGPGKYLSIRWLNGNQQFDKSTRFRSPNLRGSFGNVYRRGYELAADTFLGRPLAVSMSAISLSI